jgi:rhodanese-related sulfurtransferase
MSDIEIDVHALHSEMAQGTPLQLLDVREDWEAAIAQLPGATFIPMNELATRLEELDAAKPLVVYCHHGIRSLHVALALRSRGFANARSLRGGIDRWAVEIDPSIARY